MDPVTLYLASFVLFAIGVALFVWAWRAVAKAKRETALVRRVLKDASADLVDLRVEKAETWAVLEDLKQTAQTRALALQDQQAVLERVTMERDEALSMLEQILEHLQSVGVATFEGEALIGDVMLDWSVIESPQVPTVPGFDREALIAALEHAADRGGPWSKRPFTRRYMVNEGPLTRTQFEVLKAALVSGQYLGNPDGARSSPELTQKGEALLQAARDGAL
jgi:hypothetical protein